jgi:hypothetical protein
VARRPPTRTAGGHGLDVDIAVSCTPGDPSTEAVDIAVHGQTPDAPQHGVFRETFVRRLPGCSSAETDLRYRVQSFPGQDGAPYRSAAHLFGHLPATSFELSSRMLSF